MFVYNSDNNNDETSFADAYKSEILNKDDEEETSSKNLIIILALIAVILGLSIFGYIYMSKTNIQQPKAEETISEPEVVEPPKSNMLNNIDELILEEGQSDSVDEIVEENNTIKKVEKKNETYLEQLADLSQEIDGDKKKK